LLQSIYIYTEIHYQYRFRTPEKMINCPRHLAQDCF